MKLIGSFFDFAQRVVQTAKAGKLPPADVKKLERLLKRTGTRNLVLAKGLLSALSAGGAKAQDITALTQLLERAGERIVTDKPPFTSSEKKELEAIFTRAYLSKKAAYWFAQQMDELLAEEIDEFITGRRMISVPSRKTVSFEPVDDKRKKLLRA